MSTKNLIFSLHEEKNSWSIIYLTKDYEALEHNSSKVWENSRGLESGPERGGIGSVIEHAMAKQVHQKIDHFATWIVGVLQKFWQFWPGDLSQKNF